MERGTKKFCSGNIVREWTIEVHSGGGNLHVVHNAHYNGTRKWRFRDNAGSGNIGEVRVGETETMVNFTVIIL